MGEEARAVSADPPGDETPRTSWQLIQDRSFSAFFFGKFISLFGMWIQNVSAAVLMYDLTGSAVMVATIAVFQHVPILAFTMWGGALADRFDRRRILIIGRIVTGGAISGLGLLLVIEGPRAGGPVALLVAVLIAGCGWAFSLPPIQAILPMLVPRKDFEQALALNAIGPSLGRTAGPAVGAILLVLASPAIAFLVSGLCQLTFAALLLLVRVPRVDKPKTKPSVWGGVRYLLEDRAAGRVIIGIALITFGSDAVLTLSPSLADALDGGDEVVGYLTSAFGVGAVLLVFLFRRIRNNVSLQRTGVLGYWVLASGLVVVAFSSTIWMSCVGFVIQGLGFMMANVALNARLQSRLPEEVRGRVMALWAMAFLGTRPFAALWNGLLTEAVSLRSALLLSALAMVGASLVVRVRRPPQELGTSVARAGATGTAG